MTGRRINNALCLWCTVIAATTLPGCVGEDVSDCGKTYTLTVRAYDNDGRQLSAGEVKDVRVFVFDKDRRFTGEIEAAVNLSVPLGAQPEGDLHVVAWGNLGDGVQTWTEPEPGDLLDDCFVELAPHERGPYYVQSPGDLFRGQIAILPGGNGGDTELPVHRETGSMAVTVRNLKSFAGDGGGDYSMVVHNTPSAIGFNDILTGDEVAYLPHGSFVADAGGGEYYVAPFNLLPKDHLSIDIYHGVQRLATVSADDAGNPVSVGKGRLTNVLIDLRAEVGVAVSLTGWGETVTWKAF